MVCLVYSANCCAILISQVLHVHRLNGSQNGLTNKKFNACPQLNTLQYYYYSLWIFSKFGEKIAWSVLKMAFRAFKYKNYFLRLQCQFSPFCWPLILRTQLSTSINFLTTLHSIETTLTASHYIVLSFSLNGPV